MDRAGSPGWRSWVLFRWPSVVVFLGFGCCCLWRASASAGNLMDSDGFLLLDDRHLHFAQLSITALDAGQVVLHHPPAALAEVFLQRLFDAGVNLVVGHAALAAIGRELEERSEQ